MDIVQIVWEAFLVDRVAMTKFRKPQELLCYLTAMARSELINRVHSENAAKRGNLESQTPVQAILGTKQEPSIDWNGPVQNVEARERLETVLDELTSDERKVVELYLVGKSTRQVAELLDVSVRCVQRILKRCRERFGAD